LRPIVALIRRERDPLFPRQAPHAVEESGRNSGKGCCLGRRLRVCAPRWRGLLAFGRGANSGTPLKAPCGGMAGV
jgi:hypothetical protein